MELIYTVIAGLFILIGTIIAVVTNKNEKFIQFSISMALGVIIMLVCVELIPESKELLEHYNKLIMLLFVLIGIFILKVLDMFIPDHDDKDIKNNLTHIGIVSSIALILHNIIEGMAIYSSAKSSLEVGLLITLGVGLHNIPMGMVIESTLSSTNNSKVKNLLIIILISSSTLFGGIIMLLLSNHITNLVLGILICLTIGMLVYISIFELLGEIIESKEKKISLIGITLGIIVFLLSSFLE